MKSYQQLEYNKIKDHLILECHSEFGKQLGKELFPLADKQQIEYKLQLSNEIQEICNKNISYNFENISEITQLLLKFKHETYDFDEFKKIYFNITTANMIDTELEDDDEYPNYIALINQIIQLPDLEKRYSQIFDSEGEIKDSASPKLVSIRRKKKQLRKNIVSELNYMMKSLQAKNFLQDEIVTQRNGRFVIPVKESSTPFVNGIVHGRSGSRSSVYIEPEEVVSINNELNLMSEEEKQEIYRIMCEFTVSIQESGNEIIKNTEILQKLDFYFAVGRFSNFLDANVPKIVEKPYLKLFQARHPILIINYKDIKKVIPFNLELGNDYKLLIISGPNTGGKTVTLKTVGLLTLMALSGLPIPAQKDCEIGLFDNVFADIGDFQSLEDSLSTFSSHISNINEMIEKGNSNTLVLIDEIGAATDPEQGSALAQAILEHLTKSQVTGVITTHYTALKVFAEDNDNCINAAMQFDPNDHIPTYKFKLGLPGNSFAIEVASQLGVNTELIQRAKDLAGDQNVELTDLLKKMAEEKKELAYQSYQHKLKSALFKLKIKEFEEKIKLQEDVAKEIKKKSIRDARDFLTTMQKELNQEISEIKKYNKQDKQKMLTKTYQKITQKNISFKEKEEELAGLKRKQINDIYVGQIVWMKDFNSDGEVVEISANSVKVDINGITFSTTAKNLFQPEKKKDKRSFKKVNIPKTEVEFELKILGYRFEEAKPEIERFLDKAILSGLNSVRIVHGKGTGALRAKVRTYLRTNKNAKDFFTPPPEAGGNGVTIVSLDK